MSAVPKAIDVEVDDIPKLSKSRRAKLIRSSLRAEDLAFDEERAHRVLGTLYRRLLQNREAIRRIETLAPQRSERPEGMEVGSRDHQVWLWSSAATDVRSQSEVVYYAHKLLWTGGTPRLPFLDFRNSQELYKPEVLGWSAEDYTWALAKARFGNPRRNIEWWGRRSKTLWETWQGNPFRMFEGKTIDQVMEEKKKGVVDLPGIGPKIASLIAIFFEEIGMNPVPDAFPVDMHIQRLALALKIVVPNRPAPILNETLEHFLRQRLVKLCAEEDWSRIILAHVMWFHSRDRCTTCWKTSHTPRTCSVYDDCQGVYSSRSYFKMGLWLPEQGTWAKGGESLMSFSERPLFAGLSAKDS